jgi:ubiquitin-protein ligase
MNTLKRIMREYKELNEYIDNNIVDNHRIIHINNIDDNMYKLEIYFLGPKLTPYEEIINIILIDIPNDYPNKAPKIIFLNKVYHPNISKDDGSICLDILKDQWKPIYTLTSILISIMSLLSDPNPESPLNYEAAKYFKESLLSNYNKRLYNKIILSYS